MFVCLFTAEGFDPNYRFPAHNQETALHSAAAGGHLDVIIMMLQAGANMEAEDEDHKTPLVCVHGVVVGG